ncbi:WD40 repeat-like protein [Cylindrobasidium torrendii FP15055 ss-10]|uniref:WD40 repeat-like protein n=1 Tax=Cylindrobasidium torrendii FP15055 ss-10 TaxID=1314674 RepID=A0A0D7BAZ5_9AGAR|nr:WD40 repeat-like protein [Cylindrobasidium torrendii FP15055 ss-10]
MPAAHQTTEPEAHTAWSAGTGRAGSTSEAQTNELLHTNGEHSDEDGGGPVQPHHELLHTTQETPEVLWRASPPAEDGKPHEGGAEWIEGQWKARARGVDAAPARKLCVRHQRMADEGTNLKLQQSLDALPEDDRSSISQIWSNFSASPHSRRALILQGLLTMCCFSQLSLLTEQLSQLIRIDPFAVLPREVSLKVAGYLDATSLCRAAQVSKRWRCLADDDVLWRGICEQHIGQRCKKCGWSLPVLEKKRKRAGSPCSSSQDSEEAPPAAKRARLRPALRPWKDVYSERMTVEQNWRRGRCTVAELKGHTDGVMCVQYSDEVHPSFGVLISGSYDRTVRVWNMNTGAQLHCLTGHTRAVRALQFDDVKLITGGMDGTLKVWDWRRGEFIRTLPAHPQGVVSLHFRGNILASGGVEGLVKVWSTEAGGYTFTLAGHTDWVNAVQLDGDGAGEETRRLFSGSDDGTIREWCLRDRTCTRILQGHVAQVQSIRLREGILITGSLDNTIKEWDVGTGVYAEDSGSADNVEEREKAKGTGKTLKTYFGHIEGVWGVEVDKTRVVSASHDRTVKVWSREDGRCIATLVGHQAAVSCLAIGEERIVSGGDDNVVRIWSFGE